MSFNIVRKYFSVGEENMKEIRNSNHEIMRILSMFFIVLGHVLLFGGLLETTNPNVSIIYNFIEFILIIHVNSYVLVSGYYQSKSSFKQSKLWKIINASWFYRVVIMILFSTLGIISISKGQVIKDLLPVTLDNYWFIKAYILLYCLSPFLNKLINNISKTEYQKMLIVGFIVVSIIPNVTSGEFFENSGYTLYNFLYLYLLGAYLRIYPLDKSYIFKIFSKKMFQLIMIIIFFSCAMLNNIIFYYGKQIYGINSILNAISDNIKIASLAYSSPIIIIQSVAYFSLFTTLNFKSKFINRCSALMLGVYFIHENNYVRANIYKWLGVTTGPINSLKFIPFVFLIAITIFVSCAIIEFIRQSIFSFISKKKISVKIRQKYYELIKKIYIVR